MERLQCIWGSDTENIEDTACALANTGGGILEIRGCTEEFSEKLSEALSFMGDGIKASFDDKGASVVVLPSDYPVRHHGRYMAVFGGRVFDSTRQIEAELRRRAEKVYWLDRPYPGVHTDDLDWRAMEQFRSLASRAGDDAYRDMSDPELLDSLGLLEDGIPTGTAVLLFHPEPESIITGSFTRMS